MNSSWIEWERGAGGRGYGVTNGEKRGQIWDFAPQFKEKRRGENTYTCHENLKMTDWKGERNTSLLEVDLPERNKTWWYFTKPKVQPCEFTFLKLALRTFAGGKGAKGPQKETHLSTHPSGWLLVSGRVPDTCTENPASSKWPFDTPTKNVTWLPFGVTCRKKVTGWSNQKGARVQMLGRGFKSSYQLVTWVSWFSPVTRQKKNTWNVWNFH